MERDLTINKRIIHYRKLAGYSQSDMAEAMGMKETTYAQQERKGTLSATFVIKVSRILNIDINTLFFGEEFKKIEISNENILTTDKERQILQIWRNLNTKKKYEFFAYGLELLRYKPKK